MTQGVAACPLVFGGGQGPAHGLRRKAAPAVFDQLRGALRRRLGVRHAGLGAGAVAEPLVQAMQGVAATVRVVALQLPVRLGSDRHQEGEVRERPGKRSRGATAAAVVAAVVALEVPPMPGEPEAAAGRQLAPEPEWARRAGGTAGHVVGTGSVADVAADGEDDAVRSAYQQGVLTPDEAARYVCLCAEPKEWPRGALGRLQGLRRCRHLNGVMVRVGGFDAVSGRLEVRAGGARAVQWNVFPCNLLVVQADGRVFSGDAWAKRAPAASAVQWLSPDDFGETPQSIVNLRAAAGWLRGAGRELWPGREHERGVDVDARYYPLLRPAENWGQDARANATVAETAAQLRRMPMPTQCGPAKTEVVPMQLPDGRWPPGKQAPQAEHMQRQARAGEKGTPLERVRRWCDSYRREWRRMRRTRSRGGRGKQGGSLRFNYNALSEGGRRGLIIDDFFLDPYKNDIWDFTGYWASGARPTPVQFEHPQIHSEWNLALMAEDSKAMNYTDKNGMYDLCEVGHRSHATCRFDNKVCLFPNHVGFFKGDAKHGDHEDFVRGKAKEDREGYVKPKLYGSFEYPPRLTARCHPRGIAVQPKPDGSVKRRLTCDAGWPRVDSRVRGKLGGSNCGTEWPLPRSSWQRAHVTGVVGSEVTVECAGQAHVFYTADPRLHEKLRHCATPRAAGARAGQKSGAAAAGKQAQAGQGFVGAEVVEVWTQDGPDRRSFNEHCPLRDPLLVPPECRTYGTVDAFARGLAVLRTTGLRVGMWAHDLRAYYRFMTSHTFDVHCNLQWVECETGFELDYNLQFGAAMNCAKATATSAFFCERIRQELHKEQQRWRDEGKLAELPTATRQALAAWEKEREECAAGELWRARQQWIAEGLRPGQRAAREKEWRAAARRRTCPWFVDAYMIDDFFGGALEFFLPTVLATVQAVFKRYNVTLADGRIDVVTGVPSPNKHQVSFDEMVILGVEISLSTEAGLRRLTTARAEQYACEAEMAAEQRLVATDDFASLLGKLVFAVQVLPALRGVVAGLLGLVEQHWGGKHTMSVGGAAAGMLRLAARILRADEGMVLYPMEQPPGAAGRPVVWVFTDAARKEDSDTYTGYGVWVWPEGSDTVFVANGEWLPGEQRLHIASLELHTANIGLELAQHVMAEVCGGYEAAAEADVVMVTDSLSAMMCVRGVKATSPALRVLIQQRMARTAARPSQRVLSGFCFREQGEEADDLSKSEWGDFRQHLRMRFGREMRVVMMAPPAAEIRSLQQAWEAELGPLGERAAQWASSGVYSRPPPV